jgi:hypothetical protein
MRCSELWPEFCNELSNKLCRELSSELPGELSEELCGTLSAPEFAVCRLQFAVADGGQRVARSE